MPDRTAAQLRALENAECAYVLFIDGIKYGFATEHEGNGLLGDGAATWIALSQTAIGGNETSDATHRRNILPGLKLPSSMSLGSVSLEDGQLDKSTVKFSIVDTESIAYDLFATEGKTSDPLGQTINAGTSSLGTSYDSVPSTKKINPRGKYINLERIGASGERRLWPAIPKALTGFEHLLVRDSSYDHDNLQVSTDPIFWEGRMMALYRIYKDPWDTDNAEHQKWILWDDAHDAGDLVWWGVCRGIEVSGAWETVTISAFGPEGMLDRTLGASLTDDEWRMIEGATIELADDERDFGVFWMIGQGLGFKRLKSRIGNTVLAASYADHYALSDAISTFIYDSAHNNGGVNNIASDDGRGNTLGDNDNAWDYAYGDGETLALSGGHDLSGLPHDVGFSMRMNQNENVYSRVQPSMRVYMHRKVWGLLGYDVEIGRAHV